MSGPYTETFGPLQFTARAAEAARHEPSPVLHAFVSLRQAIAHAQLGDEVAFRSAITTARRELDRGPHETDPHWTRTVRHSEIMVFEALGKEDLGTPAQAVRLRRAVLDDTAYFLRDQAINRSGLAEALVRAGDLNQAIDHGLMILPELGTTLTSSRVLQRLQPVRRVLRKVRRSSPRAVRNLTKGRATMRVTCSPVREDHRKRRN